MKDNNIITYVENYADKTFEEFPFNEVDSLVLCQLSYLDYSNYVGGFDSQNAIVPIGDIYESDNVDSILEGYWYRENNKQLFTNVATSKRFKDMKLCYYIKVLDEENDAQFSAITYILPDKSVYLAYRGTDATLVGWKEDMKLAYSEPLKSQLLACDYMNRLGGMIAGTFRCGGHSKGGNLAVYAAMFCNYETRKRISEIYDHDGPGFRPEILKEGHYSAIRNRIHKYIPKASIVGIILENDLNYEVVECWSVGTLQHNSYVWKSSEGRFVRSKGMSESKKRTDAALNEWIYSLSDEEVTVFIDALFDILTANDAKNVFDWIKDPTKNLWSAFGKSRDMDQRTKDTINRIMKRLLEINEEKALEEFVTKSRALKAELMRKR